MRSSGRLGAGRTRSIPTSSTSTRSIRAATSRLGGTRNSSRRRCEPPSVRSGDESAVVKAIKRVTSEEGTMGKRLGALGGIAVVAVVLGAVSPAVGSSAGNQTIRVTAVFTEFDPNIDLGAPGFSIGDEVVFSGNLVQSGEQVGRIGVVCTFVSTANAAHVEAQSPATATLPQGQITTQGVIVNRSLNFTLPITGGG